MLTPTAAAIEAVENFGLSVFPIRECGATDENGKPVDKAPAIPDPQNKAKHYNAEMIQAYASTRPRTNWAVMPDERTAVIDVDCKGGKDGYESLKRNEQLLGKLPDTLTVKTPSGGLHLYFRTEKPLRGGVDVLGSGIDIQAAGKYALLYGSEIAEHDKQKGGVYKRVGNGTIATLPAAWVAAINKRKKKEPVSVEGVELDLPHNVARASHYLAAEADPAVEGEGGDETTYKTLCKAKDLGLSQEKALELASLLYNPRCVPPWTEDELEKKVENAYAYGQNDPGAYTPEAKQKLVIEALVDKEDRPRKLSSFIGAPKPRKWIVADWIPEKEITSLYGSGGVGKSLLALQLANAVATGADWLDLPTCDPLPTLCVFCEDTYDELHRRLCPTPSQLLNGVENVPLWLWSRVGRDSSIVYVKDGIVHPGPFLEMLRREIQSGKIKFLILDTISDVYLGNENHRELVNKFIKVYLGALVRDYGVTILLLGHPSKAGQRADISSGSTAWENAVRSRLSLSPSEDIPDVLDLVRRKSNYAKVGESIAVRWEDWRMVRVDATKLTAENDEKTRAEFVGALAQFVEDEAPLTRVLVDMATVYPEMSNYKLERQILRALPYTVDGVTYRHERRRRGKYAANIITAARINELVL